MQEDLLIDRFDLLCEPKFGDLATQVRDDIGTVSPDTEVRLHDIGFKDPWDFEEVYDTLYAFSRLYPFDTENENYFIWKFHFSKCYPKVF